MRYSSKFEKPYFYVDPDGREMIYFATEHERDEAARKLVLARLFSLDWRESENPVVCGMVTHKSAAEVVKIVGNRLDLEYNLIPINE